MKKIFVSLIVFPVLTSCGVYSKRISDWTGWDVILFVAGVFIFCWFGNLIYQSIEETRLADQKREQEEEHIRREKHKDHVKKMNE